MVEQKTVAKGRWFQKGLSHSTGSGKTYCSARREAAKRTLLFNRGRLEKTGAHTENAAVDGGLCESQNVQRKLLWFLAMQFDGEQRQRNSTRNASVVSFAKRIRALLLPTSHDALLHVRR